MRRRGFRITSLAVTAFLVGLAVLISVPAAADEQVNTYILVYDQKAIANAPVVAAVAANGTLTSNLARSGVIGFKATSSQVNALRAIPGVEIAQDPGVSLLPDETATPVAPAAANDAGCASTAASCPEQWDLDRIHVPKAWTVTQGDPGITVAVLDTGLTSTHEEVGTNYDRSRSTSFVEPSAGCPADNNTYRSIEDFHGHGTWTALHVAGVNGSVMSGIAPNTTLINVRVLGACGSGSFLGVLNGMQYAGDVGARVESMSLGGYFCGHGQILGSFYCASPSANEQRALWRAFTQVVNTLLDEGTIVVAAMGNDHVRIDASGQVTSDGILDGGGGTGPQNDYRGRTEAPGGVPGVVAVGATNRVTNSHLGQTRFGQFGVGRNDQLTYYSSYGERIDVTGPGGARSANVPPSDCIVTPSPCTRLEDSAPGAYDNTGAFGAWGVHANGTPCDDCYMSIQGTSMATPQVAGVAALALAVSPGLSARDLVDWLKQSVTPVLDYNRTPPVSDDPDTQWYRHTVNYFAPGIRPQLMGAGVIDAALAVGAAAVAPAPVIKTGPPAR